MKKKKDTYNANAPLDFAKRLSDVVNKSWESGEMLEKVTPVTAELLRYWFDEGFSTPRTRNFHKGQRQAILNVIYLHEVVKETGVMKAVETVAPDLLAEFNLVKLAQPKYSFPTYAVKMATGTGKTWVMHALIIWQILNARHSVDNENDALKERFTKNFLLVAPNLIVYERLLDAFLGRQDKMLGGRNADTSDYAQNQELFLPPQYRQEIFSFIQSNVVTKEDGIGRKLTGDGLIALTNWQWFENQIDIVAEDAAAENTEDGAEETDNTDETKGADVIEGANMLSDKALVNALLPVRPGKTTGNDLNTLDSRWLRGTGLKYLAELPDLMVINDEAHHIYELKRDGEVEEVEWQQGLDIIGANKGGRFFQVDFSATPYDTKGTGENIKKIYFPHIVVDFELTEAIRQGLVKLLLMDERQELTELGNLDYSAKRDEDNHVTGLSEGQRLMLRAGLTKLKMLEVEFLKLDENKNPKMMVVCEDTGVSPFVEEFLKDEGLGNDEILTIDSNRQGEVKPEEWRRIKTQLSDIDHHKKPKVIVSVLMLREGFDVNNICVLVPLRSSKAPILLEQLIGRGLRLMWREPEYESTKVEDRKRVLLYKKAPNTYIDTLSIIEHPEFLRFYKELIDGGLAAIDSGDVGTAGAVGDIMRVPLRQDYANYDFLWPTIIHDSEQEFDDTAIDIASMDAFTLYPLEQLRKLFATSGETFVSKEVTTETNFGRYKVTTDLFTAESYNEYLQKVLNIVSRSFNKTGKRGWPTLQVNGAMVLGAIDTYIRTKLFNTPFDPFQNNNWKILLSVNGMVTSHIVEQFAKAIYKALQNTAPTQAEVETTAFSSVKEIRLRESASMPVRKAIYERQGWPSHGGGLEKAFMEMLEQDSDVLSWLKIDENQHSFAKIFYIREDGLLACYHPDFLIATKEKIYLIETKGQDKVDDANVKRKKVAATEWVRKINTLQPANRMGKEWTYVLVPENNFRTLRGGNAGFMDICNHCSLDYATAHGILFD